FPTLALMARTEEQRELWGGETAKAVANFPVSGEPIPAAVARWLGRIKGAAAHVNAELGLLDEGKATRISAAATRIAAREFDDVVKSGRTHWMDAVPVTLGQEFAGYAAQARQGIARIKDALPRLGQIPLGGTATGTGLNTHPEFAARVRDLLASETGLEISPPADPFEAQA